jgi:hypothetical protein
MDFDLGLLFQVRRQFKERGVWLRRDLALQHRKQLLFQHRRIAAAMRKRRKALTRTPEFHHSGNGATAYAKSISDFVECAFARFISQHQFFS